jgi:hypothetical protein
MTTDLQLQQTMDDIFLESGFEESISYTPSGGSAKTIDAVVHRQGASQITASGPGGRMSTIRKYEIEIWISTHATTGIASITPIEDKVALKRRLEDATDTTFQVAGVIDSDAGCWHLGLR